MLKYLTVPLSGSSVSFCHYPERSDNGFIDRDMLSEIVTWSMKENLSVQFLFPEARLPEFLKEIVESVDNVKIVPVSAEDEDLLKRADILVADTFDFPFPSVSSDKVYIVRTRITNFLQSESAVRNLLRRVRRVNVVFTDVQEFTENEGKAYTGMLESLARFLAADLLEGREMQLNLLTDRMMLTAMNNCNAGHESITVSPEGEFYPCPAFIGDRRFRCGDVRTGFSAPDSRMYERRNAPICRICDAFQCRRCAWLNNALTHEVNTPGWQQCVMAHIERNAARTLLDTVRKKNPDYMPGIDIPEIDYIDPFTKLENL